MRIDPLLFAEVENRAVSERYFKYATASQKLPHARAAGLFAELRKVEDGPKSIEQALLGNFAPMQALFDSVDLSTTNDLLTHHLALYHERTLRHSTGAAKREALQRAWRAWLALADRPYLTELAKNLGDGSDAHARRLSLRTCHSLVDTLAKTANESAAELSVEGNEALTLLRSMTHSDTAGPNANSLLESARTAVTVAVDLALATVHPDFDEEEARAPSAKSAAIFEKMISVWRWSGQDVLVERAILTHGKTIGWKLYKANLFTHLLSMSLCIEPAVASFAARLAADTKHIAYASACAQMLVFHAEAEKTLDKQLPLARRAVELCPEHRNGRIVLAEVLAVTASRLLDNPGIGRTKKKSIEEATAHIAQAKELWPTCRKLKAAEEKLKSRINPSHDFY